MDDKPTPNTERAAVKQTAKAVEQDSRKVADSARKIKESSAAIEVSADRNTQLAVDRTVLAAERTYAAWMRTGLFALASGLGSRALLAGIVPDWLNLANASVLLLFSVFCYGAAVWRHLEKWSPPRPDARSIPSWTLVTVNGFLALVSLACLIGLWLGAPPAHFPATVPPATGPS
jgi:putative membrane protein